MKKFLTICCAIAVLALTGSPAFAGTACVWPTSVTASHSDRWGGTYYTGVPEYAINRDARTQWTARPPAEITFGLSQPREIIGILAKPAGSVTSFNMIDIVNEGRTIAAMRVNDSTGPIMFERPIVTDSLTIRLLEERHPILDRVSRFGGFSSFNFIVPIESDEECISPPVIAASAPATAIAPQTDLTTREIAYLALDFLPIAFNMLIFVGIFTMLIIRFDKYSEKIGEFPFIALLSIIAGAASATTLGVFDLTGELYGIQIQAGGGFAVFLIVLLIGLYHKKSR